MTDFELMMAELQVEYLAELPQRIEEIQSHFKNDEQSTLQDDFHKLKGTGKTYGLPEISELCAIVESICIHQPELLEVTIPKALSILSDIQKERVAKRSFDLTTDERFGQIRNMGQA